MSRNGAIITGAAHRIGRAIAIFLAAKYQCDIVAHYNTSHEHALDLQEIIQGTYGRKCYLFQADLCNFSTLESLVKYSFSVIPHCNILINNASVFYENSLQTCSEKDYEVNYSLHVKAPIFLTKFFAHKCRCGKVINVVDSNLSRDSTRYLLYLLAKKSLAAFTKVSAVELYPNICINAACPSKIPDHELQDLKRIEEIDATVHLCKFLQIIEELTDGNSKRTGELLHMDPPTPST